MAKKIKVPNDCSIVADYVFKRFVEGQIDESVATLRADVEAAAAFLADLPDDTALSMLDIRANHDWGPEAAELIRRRFGLKK